MARDEKAEKQQDPSEVRPAPPPAKRGHPKYDAQVIAGIVDDERRLAELRPAKAAGAPKVPDVTAENLQSP